MEACLPYAGNVRSNGYGWRPSTQPAPFSGSRLAHKAAWEEAHGHAVPDGLVLDHTCHDPATCAGGDTCPHRACVNVGHLAVVPPQHNNGRGRQVRPGQTVTACPQGHPYDAANTILRPTGTRQCRECKLAQQVRRRRRLTAAGTPSS